jgi:tRNA-binding protein
MNEQISLQDFMKVHVHTGTVISANQNTRAKKPAYVMQIDFGEDIGVKTTSAQVTDHYHESDMVGKQVVAVTNFPPLRVAGVKSEVLVLGALTESGVVLLRPDETVANGTRIA